MLRPYYKIATEPSRLLPERIPRRQFIKSPGLYPIVRVKPEPVIERRHPPALPLIKKVRQIVIKQPPVKTIGSEKNIRLRLAKAKAKARIRKLKLLAI